MSFAVFKSTYNVENRHKLGISGNLFSKKMKSRNFFSGKKLQFLRNLQFWSQIMSKIDIQCRSDFKIDMGYFIVSRV